jgi:NhaA family Na+:H+ antiporter
LPDEVNVSHLVGASLLAGIGFTMSIFVSLLAFEDEALVKNSQVVVLIASVFSAMIGLGWFLVFVPKKPNVEPNAE